MRVHYLLWFTLMLGVAASTVATAGSKTRSPSFSNDVIPILTAKCVSCHVDNTGPGNIGLAPRAAYGNIVSVKSKGSRYLRVKPGSPADSYFFMKVAGTHLDRGGSGARMPQGGRPLTGPELKIISDWIAAGAPRN